MKTGRCDCACCTFFFPVASLGVSRCSISRTFSAHARGFPAARWIVDRPRPVRHREEQQREKLAALGKLSAGLAHELNNPSAAARRSAASLRDCLERLRVAGRSSKLGPEIAGLLARREEEIRAQLRPVEHKR